MLGKLEGGVSCAVVALIGTNYVSIIREDRRADIGCRRNSLEIRLNFCGNRNNLDLELRRLQRVAVVGQGEVIEHDIREAAIGRRAPDADVSLHARIGQLIVGAAIQAPALGCLVGGNDGFQVIRAGVVDQLVHAPDTADAGNLAFAQRERERCEIRVSLGRGPAAATLAAGFLLPDDFLELVLFQPDDLAALQPDRTVYARDVTTVLAALPLPVAELAVLHDHLLAAGEAAQEINDDEARHDPDCCASAHSSPSKR
ncbi:hypothetical protein D9M70_392130 [compost metagenome]